MKEAMYYKVIEDKIQCELCPHVCVIEHGKAGRCKIRQHLNGKLYATGYGRVVSVQVDPIEKKPLYHFYPSKEILSVGFSSCNMTCSFCQNYSLSQGIHHVEAIEIEALLAYVKFGIAFTYNEPLINYEYIYEFSKLLKRLSPEKKIVLITNGMINEEPLKALLPFIDGINLDVKGSKAFYEFCGGNFDQVMKNLEWMNDVHLEVTTLAVSHHVSLEDIRMIAASIASVNPKIPYHISRYFPNFKMSEKATDLSFMMDAKKIAEEYLDHVYLGNVNGQQNTFCAKCNEPLILRQNYETKINHILCDCGYDNNIKGEI